MIKDICKEENIKLNLFSYDFIFRLEFNNKVKYIYGNNFSKDLASNQLICSDKAATSEILSYNNIDNVEHKFFIFQLDKKYINQPSIFEECKKMLDIYKKLVIKSNKGSCGDNVYYVDNVIALEDILFNKLKRLSVCPFYNIENEYRVIMLDGDIKLIYSKERPSLIGDGFSTIKELYSKYISCNNNPYITNINKKDLNKVLNKNERYLLNWKHNLSLGSIPNIVTDKEVIKILSKISKQVVDALKLNFVSVDIIKIDSGYKVLEVNSGVCMDHFSRYSESNYNVVKKIYKEAILSMFK